MKKTTINLKKVKQEGDKIQVVKDKDTICGACRRKIPAEKLYGAIILGSFKVDGENLVITWTDYCGNCAGTIRQAIDGCKRRYGD